MRLPKILPFMPSPRYSLPWGYRGTIQLGARTGSDGIFRFEPDGVSIHVDSFFGCGQLDR